MPYQIEYDREARLDLNALRVDLRRMVEAGIRRHLEHDAEIDQGARRRMRPNQVAGWRLRLDPVRVYYDVEEGEVWIVAIIVKERSRLLRRGREFRIDGQTE